ncbi:arginase family protein [Curtobacterium sp. VKM Ac-1376]|uniref:arginase family protein n=1 Tax=Curtobacterium sp. VKM Ac-1376 TaxID=123312 RepID=UPI00188A832B|nr:arginase family protein [Curtobacterium sp. VKM Ac-1376]MBF4613545.1 arginase family protein [Curtobacterium sp. VKM Ac-1376]
MQFLVVGQWQGSASSRAMRLGDGASAIAADLPRASTTVIEVPAGAGDRIETAVARYTSVLAVAERVAEETAVATEPVLVVGGDGASVLGATSGVGPDTAFVRISGSSGYRALNRAQPVAAETAALRILVDRPAELFPALRVLPASSVVVAGVRGVEDAERAALDRAGVTHLDVDAATPDALAAAVDATGATSVFVHVDLDVLDPSEVDGLLEPVPFGLDGAGLVERIQAAARGRRLAGAALTGFAPVDPDRAVDDLGVILRVVGALTSASRLV